MPWVRFDRDFDFKPRPVITIGYLAGQVRLVSAACAAAAVEAGAGAVTRRPAEAGKAKAN